MLGCSVCLPLLGWGGKGSCRVPLKPACVFHSLQKHPLPANWHLEETRRLFLQPEVADPSQVVLEWREPDEEGLVRFLAHEKHIK